MLLSGKKAASFWKEEVESHRGHFLARLGTSTNCQEIHLSYVVIFYHFTVYSVYKFISSEKNSVLVKVLQIYLVVTYMSLFWRCFYCLVEFNRQTKRILGFIHCIVPPASKLLTSKANLEYTIISFKSHDNHTSIILTFEVDSALKELQIYNGCRPIT